MRAFAQPKNRLRHHPLTPYLYIAPAVLLFSVVVLYPTLQTFRISLYDWRGLGDMTFVGLSNFQRAAGDDVLRVSFVNNGAYMLYTLLFEVGVGLAMALLLNKKGAFHEVLRVSYFFPMMVSLTVVGILWGFVYNPVIGLLNHSLNLVGLGHLSRAWLADPSTALVSVSIVSGWVYSGLFMILFYAALQRVPRHLIEAASIDGAKSWQINVYIVLPLLREVTVIAILLCMTGAFKAFDLFWVMTGGGPYHATEIVSTWLYKQAFQFQRMGYGAAIAVVMTGLVLFVSVVYLSYTRRRGTVQY